MEQEGLQEPDDPRAGSPDSLHATVNPYREAIEQIEDAKFLVRLWLQRHLLLYEDRYNKPSTDYTDLYVGRKEVESFLAGRLGPDATLTRDVTVLNDTEKRFRSYMEARAVKSAEQGMTMPLEEMRAAFDVIEPRLADVIIALLVAEIDPDFLRAYARAWCDFTRRHITVGFLLELLSHGWDERERLVSLFTTLGHPVFQFGVIRVDKAGAGIGRLRVERPVRLSDRAVEFLCGGMEPPVSITGSRGGMREARLGMDDVLVPDDLKQRLLSTFKAGLSEPDRRHIIVLHGPQGTGRRSLAAAATAQMGYRLLEVDLTELPLDPPAFERRLVQVLREARLQQAIPLLSGADVLCPSLTDDNGGPRTLMGVIESIRTWYRGFLLIVSHQGIQGIESTLPGTLQIKVPHPTPKIQQVLWARALGDGARFSPGFDIEAIVGRYSLAGGVIAEVAKELAAGSEQNKGFIVSPERVFPVVRNRLQHKLGALAIPVERGFAWEDLVVSERTRQALKELVSFVRHRERIVGEWGFGQKVKYGRGTSGLFHGPPGTGKTMAASIIGTELGIEVFQIDLSRIVDKYIGETEKNLARVFDEAGHAQALLLFDEADSLFAKRTSVKTSVDRYANLEVNFLLQMMEAYEGVCVLTSNFPEQIDEAFKRRIRFKVPFPFPDAGEREEIWRRMMPASAPVSGDADYARLAADYELSGAQIKNVVLRAASMAAERGQSIDQEFLVQAANREYAEMGKAFRQEPYDEPRES